MGTATKQINQPAVPAELRAAIGDVALTPRQWECLAAFYRLTEAADGVSPTMEEVAAELGICKTTVWEHLRYLDRKGVVSLERYRFRSVRIINAADRERSQLVGLRIRCSALERAIRLASTRLTTLSGCARYRPVASVLAAVAADLESALIET